MGGYLSDLSVSVGDVAAYLGIAWKKSCLGLRSSWQMVSLPGNSTVSFLFACLDMLGVMGELPLGPRPVASWKSDALAYNIQNQLLVLPSSALILI